MFQLAVLKKYGFEKKISYKSCKTYVGEMLLPNNGKFGNVGIPPGLIIKLFCINI